MVQGYQIAWRQQRPALLLVARSGSAATWIGSWSLPLIVYGGAATGN
jgi:hypothetical protein